MLLTQVHEEYLAYRKVEGYKPNTMRVDHVALCRLRKAVGNIKVDEVTVRHIDRLYEAMAEERLSASTVNLSTAVLRSFFRWTISQGYRPEGSNPVQGRRYRPRETRPMPRVPLAQFPALLGAARTPRDRMLIALGLYTMGRATELTGIQIKHLDLASEEIELYVSKSNTYDRMPISKELRREIARWLPIYEAECGPVEPDWFLVPAVQGGKHSPETGNPLRPWKRMASPEDAVKHALNQIGVTGYRTGCHVLRRSSARAMFDELVSMGYDGSLRIVSAWLHHASVTMTERYLGLDVDRANRDNVSKGELMFPSLEAENVVPFRKDEDERGQAV